MESLATRLNNLALNKGFTVVSDINSANIIISLGGDNAFLQATRKTGFRDDCLYVGINTDQLSFYTDFTLKHPEAMFDAIMNEELEVRRYPVIEVTIDERMSFYCLNECSIRSHVTKAFVMDVYIDDFLFETFRGDGMIISTPTGSTAYNKSVNGAVIDPTLPSMQVSEIASLNNNEYRTLGSSFVLGLGRALTLKVDQKGGNTYSAIAVDNEALNVGHAKKLQVQLADRHINVLKLKTNSFWQRVKRKFL